MSFATKRAWLPAPASGRVSSSISARRSGSCCYRPCSPPRLPGSTRNSPGGSNTGPSIGCSCCSPTARSSGTKAGDFDHDRTTALSTVIHGKCADEPLYTDLRWAKGQGALDLTHVRFRDAMLSVAAPVRAVPKDELDGEDVRQLRRNRRLVRALVGAIAVAAVLAGWQWFEAATERNVARAQARVAASRQLVAQSRLPENALDKKLLLAAEAYQIAPTRDAHENLIRLFHDNDRFDTFLSGHDSPVSAAAFSAMASGSRPEVQAGWRYQLMPDGARVRFARSEALRRPMKDRPSRDLKFTNTGTRGGVR